MLVAAVALWLGLRLKDLLLVYWAQSVMIGVSFLVRMIARIWQESKEWVGGSVNALVFGGFFVGHFGFFHFIYLFFLWPIVFWSGFGACVLAFALAHAYSLWRHLRDDHAARVDSAKLLWLPYARILPMHLTLILGDRVADISGIPGALVLFLVLKAAADVAMHLVERRILRGE